MWYYYRFNVQYLQMLGNRHVICTVAGNSQNNSPFRPKNFHMRTNKQATNSTNFNNANFFFVLERMARAPVSIRFRSHGGNKHPQWKSFIFMIKRNNSDEYTWRWWWLLCGLHCHMRHSEKLRCSKIRALDFANNDFICNQKPANNERKW